MKIGLIGCGNMASAMIGGILKQNYISKENIIASGPHQSKMDKIAEEYGITAVTDNRQVAQTCEILVLSVKPAMYESVIKEIKDCVSREQIIVTIAPGLTMEQVECYFGQEMKIIRTMPNTPAMVLEGMTGMCYNEYVDPEEFEMVQKIFGSFGKAEQVPEHLMNAVVGVSGSSPAFVYLFIEALADAAVREGLSRNQAYTFAAQSVLGSAKMVLESGKHPGELKDAVCSPGGTTIEGVKALEADGFRNAVMDAVSAAARKGDR